MSVKQLLIKTIIAVTMILSAQAFALTESLDRIVAVVNDEMITESVLITQAEKYRQQILRQGGHLPSDSVLRHHVLDQLINTELQIQFAKEQGIAVTPRDVNEAIAGIAKHNNISVSDLMAQVAHEGFTAKSYRKDIEEQLLIVKLHRTVITPEIVVTPEDVSHFIKESQKKVRVSEYRVSDLLIPLSEIPSSDQLQQASQQAAKIKAIAQKGEDFSKLAMATSADVSALEGGDLGWRKLAELPSIFADEVKGMKVGEVSGPIRAPNGIHVIKLVNKRVNAQLSSAAKQERQEVEELLFKRKFNDKLKSWLLELRKNAYIKVTL